MDIISSIITVIYYIIIAFSVSIMIYNLVKSKSWEKEIMYVLVLLPFILRLFRLK